MIYQELIPILGIAFTSFILGYLLSELQNFRKYIKDNCLNSK